VAWGWFDSHFDSQGILMSPEFRLSRISFQEVAWTQALKNGKPLNRFSCNECHCEFEIGLPTGWEFRKLGADSAAPGLDLASH
jgi:hypothetical protein